ncbi:MAG: RNA methyltransferase [Candidatus Doudnabacteria bacterium CG10_big_fil_rev_8_21_14_0_10_41_10]|uniref:RNA methyltransferase n=1 Tax=Candidatus Doudnabacteria bacterium CG10_big_fil_rev_8_21_14_0_10_41_10 TaxID=1974551 RepID=A0A2H0VEI2_9BACT|nr:MAG: RNA methyltransferase [Candidatus Doudnabacteria bacterium CG10_big_fil_rev_8_21_14_0_10_41_10]
MYKGLFYIISHNIRSLYNVGSIFRTADAFGVDKIILTGYTGTPKNFRLAKTALGAEKLVAWEYQKHLKRILDKLEQYHFQIVALENNVSGTISLNKFKPKFPCALLLGEEVKGIKKDYLKLCDKIVEIPMQGKKESLNVSVAAGIAMHYISSFWT